MMSDQFSTRRDFIRKAAIGGALAVSIPEIITAAVKGTKNKKCQLNDNDIILFQGDSITDGIRNENDRKDPRPSSSRALGCGYVVLAAAQILEKYPSKNFQIFNRGISGNKVTDLADRWDSDCLALKPDILSIMVGIVDFSHPVNEDYHGTIKPYLESYTALLERTKTSLPNVKLIIGEPFVVPGIMSSREKWYPSFFELQKGAQEIARSFDATFIPFQSVLDEAQKRAPGVYWTFDGVHTTLAGSQLLAHAWLAGIAI